MKTRLNEIVKGQTGSSLAFVLIIGMIIMIMVASLLAVANSDFTFTQETVESRQAYIDAKSVIEFGKIEINSRMKNLNAINEELYQTYEDYKTAVEAEDSADIVRLGNRIVDQESQRESALNSLKAPLSIFGDEKNVVETLSENSEVGEKVGALKVEEAGNQYKFIIETENLRRKLDYTISFSYDPSTMTETQNPGGTVPVKPVDIPVICDYAKVQINAIGSQKDPKLKANIQGKGNDKEEVNENGNKELNINYPLKDLEIENKFEWIQGRTLNMSGKNILVTETFPTSLTDSDDYISHFNITAVGSGNEIGELRFKQDYYQKNKGLNKFVADNVIFEKNVKIGDKGVLEIKCKNLFINGNLELEPANSKLIIEADNIVFTKNIQLGSGTEIDIDCKNIWIDENVSTQSSGAKFKFKNVNYLKTGNMNLENAAELTVIGEPGKDNNIMICGYIKPPSIGTHSLKLSMTSLSYCIFDGLELDQNCTALISSDFVRFKNNYKQFNGDVVIKDAENVVFNGKKFDLDGNWNSYKLRVESNHIYLDTDSINIRRFNTDDYRGFMYLGKNGVANANLYLKQTIVNWSNNILAGKYSSIGGDFPRVGITEPYRWLYDLTPTNYTSPSWSDPLPGSGGSSVSVSDGAVTLLPGAEKYY